MATSLTYKHGAFHKTIILMKADRPPDKSGRLSVHFKDTARAISILTLQCAIRSDDISHYSHSDVGVYPHRCVRVADIVSDNNVIECGMVWVFTEVC